MFENPIQGKTREYKYDYQNMDEVSIEGWSKLQINEDVVFRSRICQIAKIDIIKKTVCLAPLIEEVKEESLEDKICKHFKWCRDHCYSIDYSLLPEKVAQIATDHFKKHPEELGPINQDELDRFISGYKRTINQMQDYQKNLVSIDEVLECFDKSNIEAYSDKIIWQEHLKHVRQALEGLRKE